MKKSTICSAVAGAVIAVTIVVSLIFFLPSQSEKSVYADSESTFVRVEDNLFDNFRILYDRDTEVLYVWTSRGCICPLYNADGTLKLYDGD